MVSLFDKVKTYYALGLSNLFWVAKYRLAQKRQYFVKKMPITPLVSPSDDEQCFFTVPENTLASNASSIVIPPLTAFGWLPIDQDKIPNWLASISNQAVVENNTSHWSTMNDFDLAIGDIKAVWELSRFDWLLNFSLQYKATNDASYIKKINSWLTNWCLVNPINQGVNWKCGQETSIRLLHLALARHLLAQEKQITPILTKLIFAHLQRIAPTLHYAMAQDNNHGTSEAAALYIGASLLLQIEQNEQTENKLLLIDWKKQGRYWLENRAKILIDQDGTFSQYSVNYHRLMLDTLSLSEFFRQSINDPLFSQAFYQKAILATHWLFNFVDPSCGEAPNMGLNDGANLLPLTDCDYRDYRPSVQLASSLFTHSYAYPVGGNYQQICQLLPASNSVSETLLTSNIEPSQGFQLISQPVYQPTFQPSARVYLRTPNAKFRPSCCDALHADVWIGNINVLKGTGSYSYNCEKKWQDYFPSVSAHNTISFDEKEQMPRLSRFLYSQWISTTVNKINKHAVTASYTNKQGHHHERQVAITDHSIIINDKVSGFTNNAKLYWHLATLNWQLKNNELTSENITITINSSDNTEITLNLVEGAESRYYLKKSTISVLQVSMTNPCTITTTIKYT